VRKIAITYKMEAASPRYVATIYGWNVSPGLKDSEFEFSPPARSRRIDMVTFSELSEAVEGGR
jgi:hypothetical protein